MSWFDEQIKIRENADMEAFEDSCLRIAGSVMGKSLTAALHDERQQAKDAIGEVLKYYHCKPVEIPDFTRGAWDRVKGFSYAFAEE